MKGTDRDTREVEMRMRSITIVVALLGSALAGLVAVRTTEVQPAVLVIAVVCLSLGFAVPRLAWLWAILVGGGVFLGYVFAHAFGLRVAAEPQMSGHPNIYGSLIAIVPAIVFAYIGAGTRWIAGPGMLAETDKR